MRSKYRFIKKGEAGLEQLFGSKTRLNLLKLFFNNPSKTYYVREIVREVGAQINSVRRELQNLKCLGIINEIPADQKTTQRDKGKVKTKRGRVEKKYHTINTDFLLYQELKSLLIRAQLLLEKKLVKTIQRLGNPYYLILTGFFVSQDDVLTDILLVGKFNRRKLEKLVKSFEREFGREINYTAMSRKEFNYRKDITDRFLYNILENKKIVIIDRLSKMK